MFGWFRLCAAVLVVVGHIAGVEFVAGIAVRAFFLLSGYLMAAILTERYGLSRRGIVDFSISRAWRLLPTYWVSILLTMFLVIIFANTLDPRLINNALAVPSNLRDLFAAVFIVGHTTFGLGRVADALSPSAWAVDVEILMYICSCLFLARNAAIARRTTWCLLALVPVLWLIARHYIANGNVVIAGQLLYSFLPSALLPYALGTVLWFHRRHVPSIMNSWWLFALALAGLTLCMQLIFPKSVTAANVLSLPCLLVIVNVLSTRRARGLIFNADVFAGRMAYPIYLLHWTGA